MKHRPELPEVEVNLDLLEIESRLAKVFDVHAERMAELKFSVNSIVSAIERSGTEGYFTSPKNIENRPKVEILGLDLAWLSPGPLNTWASEGTQVCFCRHKSKGMRQEDTWYGKTLTRYFDATNAASLLSLPEIYRKKSFVRIEWLTDLKSSPSRRLLRARHSTVWRDTFIPRQSNKPSNGQWSERFSNYKTLISRELQDAMPTYDAKDVMLVWVYVGPGVEAEAGLAPRWGASLFLIFRFRDGHGKPKYQISRNAALLVSNLHHALRNVAPAVLGSRCEKQNLAQALAHEFKNFTQDVAVVSQMVRTGSTEGNPIHKQAVLRENLEILHLSIQALSAFSIVSYWLFSPNKNLDWLIPDKGAESFRNGLALAIRLVAPSRTAWDLSRLPTFDQIRNYFHQVHGDRSQSIERLASKLPIAYLLFFALEPVRNIGSGSSASPGVSFSIRHKRRCVFLDQTTIEPQPANKSKKSESIEFLMQQVKQYCPLPLITVDPIVKTRTIRRAESGGFVVVRTTRFDVENIIAINSDTLNAYEKSRNKPTAASSNH